MKVKSYALDQWIEGNGSGKEIFHAVTGEKIAEVTSEGLDFKAMLDYANRVGSPNLRKMTFHERGRMLKALAQYLMSRKEEFYRISEATGATANDHWVDIDGGIGTLFVFSSKGRRELPDQPYYVEGNLQALSRGGSFVGHHICVPLQGASIHINAFNFPCWGMLEKIAPSLLAGVPAIVKPASLTCYVTEAVVKAIIESEILPKGALQLICGGIGDLFEHLTCQNVVTFTGSAHTGRKLREHPNIIANSIRFNLEADSLNCCILGEDVQPEDPEFDLFIKEVVREMTVKAGQKCTAIRRTLVPEDRMDAVIEALSARLDTRKLGNPQHEEVKMGPLAGLEQVREVREKVQELQNSCEIVYGDLDNFEVVGGEKGKGAFFPAILLRSSRPFESVEAHEVEAFGPVNTLMGYKNTDEAIELAKRGQGSLVGSLFTANDNVARQVTLGTAPFHGRLLIVNRDCGKESTGHGSPLPHMIHGGPGRAGGGEELGGVRAVLHYMQRCAVQGSPTTLSKICGQWLKGGTRESDRIHPFQKYFEELEIGEALITHRRTITEADVVNFAGISGDFFYAHTDSIAAKDSLFEKRVAHGYFVVSAAAGLFVHPAPGPVLANYGLDDLRFLEPVYIGDTIYVKLTCQQKTAKEKREENETPQGIVRWDVEVFNQDEVMVASYSILTLVARKEE